ELSENLTASKLEDRMVRGTCLYSDVAGYSRLAEQLPPAELNKLMNRYYELIFAPVREQDGSVIDTRGDAMIAVWAAIEPDKGIAARACRAALDIQKLLTTFTHGKNDARLTTRIGLHSGSMLLGNVGALDYYDFNPIGDVVNTSARPETLNKTLGTRILVSRETAIGAENLVFRPMGRFRLKGKTRLVDILELVCREHETTDDMLMMNAMFASALAAFSRRDFREALSILDSCLTMVPQDGPSLFYTDRAKKYLSLPPPENWAGEVDA
ncbi:MAG TPA: adenylate/guanylate cyclase domain-containing protein, partial [Desulfosarcina sp.]|nr:adenylate/guanylate cyclase domain-containing protein [Desulfosarcina sp.]